MIEVFITKLLPLIALTFIGFVWAKKQLPFSNDKISFLIMNICAPALLIASINNDKLTLENIFTILVSGSILVVFTGFITALYLRFEGKNIRPYLQSFILPNTGAIGMPIVFVFLGEVAFIFALTFSTLINIFHYTIGLYLSNKQLNFKKALQTPVLYALIIAIFFKANETSIPSQLENIFQILGFFLIPLLLFSFGTSLVNIKFKQNIQAFRMGIIRVFIGLISVVLLVNILNIETLLAQTLIIQYSMPIATTAYLFALTYKGPKEDITAMVASSTFTACLLLPFILYFLNI
jgi:predicted permease